MKYFLLVLFCFLGLGLMAQNFSTLDSITTNDPSDIEFLVGKGDKAKKIKRSQLKRDFESGFYPIAVNVMPFGNPINLRGKYVKNTGDSTYYVNMDGSSFYIGSSGRVQIKTLQNFLQLSMTAMIGDKAIMPTGEEATKINPKKWITNRVKSKSAPVVNYIVGMDTISNEYAIWENPNFSINGKSKVEFVLKDSIWYPLKGYIDVTDAGAKGDGVTDNTLIYNYLITQLPLGGYLYFPAGNFKGQITLSGRVGIKGSGQQSVLTSLNNKAAIVIDNYSNVAQGMIEIESVTIKGYNGIHFTSHLASRIIGENLIIDVTNIGILKSKGNIYNSWRDCQIFGGQYCIWARGSAEVLMHTGAEKFDKCRIGGAKKAAIYIDDATDGAGKTDFSQCYFEGNPGFVTFIKSYGLSRNIIPFTFDNCWNEANSTLDSVIIDLVKYKTYNFYLKNVKNAVFNGSFTGSMDVYDSNVTINNAYLGGYEIRKDNLSYITGNSVFPNGSIGSSVIVENIKGFWRGTTCSYMINKQNVSTGKTPIMSYNYADANLISGGVKEYDKYLFDSCQSKNISGFTQLSPIFIKTQGKYGVFTIAIKNKSNAESINIAYDVGLNNFAIKKDTTWQTYTCLSFNNSKGGNVLANATGTTGKIFMSAMQYLEFDTYDEAVEFANAGIYIDLNTKNVNLQKNGNNIFTFSNLNIQTSTNSGNYSLNVNGSAFFNVLFKSYTPDGLFGVGSNPVIFGNANGDTRIGYYTTGDGSYYGRIGHLNGANKVTYGAYGANIFTVSTGATNTERLRITDAGIGINKNNIEASAILDINSTNKGVLFPRMTTAQRDAITSPVEGLEIYNLSTHKKNYFNGTSWIAY
jgi:hypothetical protein